MAEVFDIKIKAKEREARVLDAKASYVALEQCLKIIEMNGMPELRDIKAMMRRTMKDLRDIGDGKKRS